MNCCSNELLLDWLDKSLDAAQSAEVAAHLDECPSCRKRLAEVSGGYHFLRSELPAFRDSMHAPEFLAMRIKHNLAHVPEERWWGRTPGFAWAAAAAVAVILTASLAYRVGSRPGSPDSNASQTSRPAALNASATNPQPPQILILVPRLATNRVHELQRRDTLPNRLPPGQQFTVADDSPAQPVQPEPTVQAPVLMVRPVNYDPEM